MIQKKVVKLENQLICANNHQNESIKFILQKNGLKAKQRLLCQQCLADQNQSPNMMIFSQVERAIQAQQEKLYNYLNVMVKETINNIQSFKSSIDQLKTNFIQMLDELIRSTELWMSSLQDLDNQGLCYSLLEKLENFDQPTEEKISLQNKVLQQCNYLYFKKIKLLFNITTFKEDLYTCQQTLFGVIRQNYFKTNVYVEKNVENDIPKMATQYCSKHKSKITDICILKNIKKDERLKCIYCMRDNSIQISEFEKLWKRHNTQKMEKIQECRIKQIVKQQKVKELLSSLTITWQKCMKLLIDQIDQSTKFNQNFFLVNENESKSSESDSILEKAEELSQVEENKLTQAEITIEKEHRCANQNVLNKLQELIDPLLNIYKAITSQFTGELTQQGNSKHQVEPLKVKESLPPYNKISYQLTDDKVKQEEWCYAIAFNTEGSVMVANCGGKIIVWRLENGQLKEQLKVLEGHDGDVSCLVLSKKVNWFASGSHDYTIRCWKDMGNNEWKSSQPQKVHTQTVYCILLNQNEDQLISCSRDKSIKIWGVDQQSKDITYEYSLDKHTDHVNCISLNESETTLVSCSDDKQILIWGKGENRKWEYQYPITKSADDYGYRICFINDNMIAWQQRSQGFTHFFNKENDKFIEKPELKIELKEVGGDIGGLFPSVFNKSKQVLIQKHNKYVYIIRVSNDGKQFNIEQEPIDCSDFFNYGGLAADGQHLVIWNFVTKQFRVYRLKYQ